MLNTSKAEQKATGNTPPPRTSPPPSLKVENSGRNLTHWRKSTLASCFTGPETTRKSLCPRMGNFSAWSFLLVFLVSTVQNFLDDLPHQRGFWVQTDFPLVLQGGYHFHVGALRSRGDHLQITDHFGRNPRCGG